MTESLRGHWFRSAAWVALGYVLVGAATAALARSAPTPGIRTLARLAAWGVSAALFGAHIALERGRQLPTHRAAGHTSAAVALATLVLAGVAVVHQARAGTLGAGVLLALAIWPALTGMVSFLVSSVAFAVLRRSATRA